MIKYLFEWFGKLNEMARITSLYVIVLHFDCCITFSYLALFQLGSSVNCADILGNIGKYVAPLVE